jgi:hypothetical protein
MFRRSRAEPPAHDPLVTDRHGRVVGIRTSPPSPPREDKASRLWRRRKNLAETGELRRQAELRNQVSAFHVEPGPSANVRR